MTLIVFVRHGDSDVNKFIHDNKNDSNLTSKINTMYDPELTDIGVKQAAVTAKFINDKLIKQNKKFSVLTSPYIRAVNTAKPLLDLKNTNIIDYYMSGLLLEYTRPEIAPIGAISHHTWKEFTDKIVEFVNYIENFKPVDSETLIIYGHSLFISVLLGYIGSNKKFIPTNNDIIFSIPNCSLSVFNFDRIKKKWSIFKISSTEHLNEYPELIFNYNHRI